jgi:polar amino acid transport system ATP-binding protein
MSEPMVLAENVWKSFGSNIVLKGVDLRVEKGQVVVLLGPSGGGKSTILRCINHLEKIQGGRLSVDGTLVGYHERKGKLYEMRTKEVSKQRSAIGMVFQAFNLFPHMTTLENVTVAPIRVKKQSHQEALEIGTKMLARVGLSDRADYYPNQLSGGQQQRVAIARALCMQPKLMLFDEPTSALDPELVGEVLKVMEELAHEGATMIVVTHEMAFAREAADRVYYIDEGLFIEAGPPEQVIEKPQDARTAKFLARLLGKA